MLGNIEAPTDFPYPPDRRLQAQHVDKIVATIAASPVRIEHSSMGSDTRKRNLFNATLPHVRGAGFWIREQDTALMLSRIDIGDPALFRRGIGTRLVEAGTAHALALAPNIQTFYANNIRIAVANTAIKIFGYENVTIMTKYDEYGAGTGRALEEVFDDHPPMPGKPYLLHKVSATINNPTLARDFIVL